MSEDDPYGQHQGQYPYETGHDYNERKQWHPADPYIGVPPSDYRPSYIPPRPTGRDIAGYWWDRAKILLGTIATLAFIAGVLLAIQDGVLVYAGLIVIVYLIVAVTIRRIVRRRRRNR